MDERDPEPAAGAAPDAEPAAGGTPDAEPATGMALDATPDAELAAGPADRRLLARLPVGAGLCATCVHLRLLSSPRSVFVRCGLAATDPRFPRYPALPVLTCSGYRRDERAGAPD